MLPKPARGQQRGTETFCKHYSEYLQGCFGTGERLVEGRVVIALLSHKDQSLQQHFPSKITGTARSKGSYIEFPTVNTPLHVNWFLREVDLEGERIFL